MNTSSITRKGLKFINGGGANQGASTRCYNQVII
ncbi:hypothetical protein T01_15348 [Trichinella spiralis]|uniref:Uncharacterized protein n=1 Tax=Trichinella spiralis TaxID=6334 RepID=A0A0V1AM15_TRISP|nr:hypothetical protein T01_15348 [Trichinella spiralis]